MNLLWEIKNFDWFYMYSDDAKYYKQGLDKLDLVCKLIKEETDIKVLCECINEIPDTVATHVKSLISTRIVQLSNKEF